MNKYYAMHIEKYPDMQIEDKIKLIMQSTVGCGHLVTDISKIFNNIIVEYNQIKDYNLKDDMIEDIGIDFVRVYLKPFVETYGSISLLVNAFTASSKYIGDKNQLIEELRELRETETEANQKYIDEYLKKVINEDNVLISHSAKYRQLYNPHYLVIHRSELAKLLTILNTNL